MIISGLFTIVVGFMIIAIIVGLSPTTNRWIAIIPLIFLILGAAAFALISKDRSIVRKENA